MRPLPTSPPPPTPPGGHAALSLVVDSSLQARPTSGPRRLRCGADSHSPRATSDVHQHRRCSSGGALTSGTLSRFLPHLPQRQSRKGRLKKTAICYVQIFFFILDVQMFRMQTPDWTRMGGNMWMQCQQISFGTFFQILTVIHRQQNQETRYFTRQRADHHGSIDLHVRGINPRQIPQFSPADHKRTWMRIKFGVKHWNSPFFLKGQARDSCQYWALPIQKILGLIICIWIGSSLTLH